MVTLEALLDIADAIRPYMELAMKIEVAPWIKEYVVNMEDLYTELILEKLNNKPYGLDKKDLSNYRELFMKVVDCATQGPSEAKRQRTDDQNITQNRPMAHKIVMKGDPGMGKTTLCKKIAWDWARRLFREYNIVFFVFLKLVKPEDVVEKIIVQQNPFLAGLSISESTVGSILKTFGSRCLLILDGLDEHALGTNQDVFKIITENC